MIEEVIRINTETKGGESVKSLRQEIRDATQEAVQLSRKFGETSPQAVEAAKKVAKLRDEMEDFNKKVQALNPDKFQKIATLTQSVAGGIAAAQGAMVLFGDVSEDAAKSLAKVQGAIAFSQGVQQILDMRKQLGSLVTDMLGKVKTAFTTVAGASRLIGQALGIGLITTGLALIVKYFDQIKAAIYDLIPGLKSVVEGVTNIFHAITDWIGVTSEAERANEKLLESTTKMAKQVEQELEINGDKYDKYQRDRLEAYSKYLAAYNEALKNDAKLSASERNELLKGLADRYNRDLAAIDQQRTADEKKEQEKRNADYQKSLDERKKADEEFLKEQSDLNNTFADMGKKARKAEIQAEEDLRLAKLSARERELEDLRIKFEEKKTVIQKGGGDVTAVENLYAIELANLNDKYHQEDLAKTEAKEKEKTDLLTKEAAKRQADAEAVNAAIAKSEEMNYNSTKSLLNSAGALFAQNAQQQKAFAIAQIAVDTAKAISGLTSASQLNPANATTFGAAGASQFVAGIAQIAANIAQAVAIIRAPNPVSGGGGGSAGGGGVTYTPVYNFGRLQGSDVGGYGTKVYVLQGDMTDAQNKVAQNRKVSVF